MCIGLNLSIVNRQMGGGGGGGAPDTDAQAYFDRIVAAGSTIDSTHQTAIDTFVKAAKAHGYWSKLIDVSPLAGANLTAARQKLKAYGASGYTLTNTSFVDGDYNPSSGVTGGTNKRLNTEVAWNAWNSAIIGQAFFLNDEFTQSDAGNQFFCGVWGNPYCTLLSDNGRPTSLGTYHGTGSDLIKPTATYGVGRGLYHGIRTTSSFATMYYNGAVAATRNAASSITVPSTKFTIGGNSGGNCLKKFSFYALDDGTMDDTLAALYATDVLALQVALGRVTAAQLPTKKVIIIGQSLATGVNGNAALSTTQAYNNKSFTQPLSVTTNANEVGSAIRTTAPPLVEGAQETIAAGMSAWLSERWRQDHASDASQDLWISNWARGGKEYAYLKKGGTYGYAESIVAIQDAKTLATKYASAITVPGILCVHGEADQGSNTYQVDIEQWQSDYQTDIAAITGQVGVLPIFHSQHSSWSATNVTTAKSPYALLAAYEANPTKTILVCPKYFITHHSDGVHLVNEMYRWLGEYYAKAWYAVVALGGSYSPLRPTSILRTGANIDVTFAGNVGDIELDDTLVSDPGNYGFEYTDDSSPPAIDSVTVTGSNTIRVTLASTPTGTNKRLRYAYTGVSGNDGGPTTGARGCVRDSDPAVSLHEDNLYNWCVHFDKAAT